MLQAIAESSHGLGKYDLAIRTWSDAQVIAEQLWGPNDARTIRCSAGRADALEGSGDELASLKLREAILSACKERYGRESPEFLQALSDVGMLQFDLGRIDLALLTLRSELELTAELDAHQAAIDLCRRQVERLAEVFGDDHEAMIAPLQRLASLYFQNGNRGMATSTMQRAIAICESVHGRDSVPTWNASASMALMVRPSTAEKGIATIERVRDAASETLQSDHPLLLSAAAVAIASAAPAARTPPDRCVQFASTGSTETAAVPALSAAART